MVGLLVTSSFLFVKLLRDTSHVRELQGVIVFLLGQFFFLARAGRAEPFFFDDRQSPAMLASVLFRGPGRPKVGRPLTSAVIGHAHVPRFSCLQKWRRQAMCKVK